MSASAIEGAQSGIRQDPLSCWWKIPNKNITVLLDMRVVDRINEDIKNGAVQGNSNLEIGGLLLGTITFDPTLQVMVTECFPVSCNHELGPSHRLSYADRMLLRKQLNRYKETRGEFQYFVSYYRSNLGPDFRLTSSDLAMARDFVPDLFFFLLVQPSHPINIGGLFFSGEEPAQPESRILFPFDKARLLSGDMILRDSPQGTMSASAIEEESLSLGAPPNEMPEEASYSAADFAPSSLLRSLSVPGNERKIFSHRWTWISLAAVLVLALGGFLYKSMKSDVSPAMPPKMEIVAKLGLEANVAQNQLYVKWNKTFPGVQTAKKGILSVQDGASTQTINLSSQELLRGDIALPFSGDKVSVQLLLVSEESMEIRPVVAETNAPSYPDSQALTETAEAPSGKSVNDILLQPQNPVVSLSPKTTGAIQTPPRAVAVQPRPLPKEPTRITSGVIEERQAHAAGASQPTNAPVSRSVPESKPKRQQVVVTESPIQSPPASQPKEEPAIRQPQITTFPTAVSPEAASGANAGIPELKPAAVIARSADPMPPPVPSAIPKANPESPDAFVPPRPMEGLRPIILPSSLRSQMPESMQIDVRVYVDASGDVIGAKSLYDNVQVSRLAVEAIRRMRFTPARRGNQNVASDLVLRIRLATD